MKIAVAFLVLLGLMAAVAATLLVQTLTAGRPAVASTGTLDSEVQVLIATRDLPMLSIVDSTAVVTKKVPRDQVPEGALLNSVQVVGKVLTSNMVKDQPYTKTSFARQAEGVYLAASLPPGKRALSFSLSDWSGMAGLLYPGSVVDVLVSFKPPGTGGELVTTTLLQGLQVLAIGSQSIAAEDFADKEPGALAKSGRVNFRMITLLVDPKQAEILQLAIQHGNISLAMRNPLDTGREARRLTRSEELAISNIGNTGGGLLSRFTDPFEKFLTPAPQTTETTPAEGLKEVPPEVWETLINRAGVIETKTFELSEAELTVGPTTRPESN